MRVARIVVALLASSIVTPANSLPVLEQNRRIAGVTVYPDHRRNDLFYLHPRPVQLALHADGRPQIEMTLTYYVGSKLRDDAGSSVVRWSMSIGVERGRVDMDTFERVRQELMRSTGHSVSLEQLPVQRVPVTIDYAPADSAEELMRVDTGYVDGSDAPSMQWTRRTLSFPLGKVDGNLIRSAFDNQGALLSVSWAYVVQIARQVPGGFDASNDIDDPPEYEMLEAAVEADSLRVEVDAEQHPAFLRIVDLNSTAPPGFPGLAVICTDFARPTDEWEWQEKEIEIEATGVAGQRVRERIIFPNHDSEVSLQRIAFSYAVFVDRGFRYRVRGFDGAQEVETPWLDVGNWAVPLNVSGDLESFAIGETNEL